MDVLILKMTFRVAPAESKHTLTKKLSELLRISDRNIHDELYRMNPQVLYSKSIDYCVLEDIIDYLELISKFEKTKQFELI